MFVAILVLHILLSVLLIVIVLIQQRSKGGMAGVFGGGGGTGAEQLFGSSGVAPFMTRITSILGAAFMLTSLLLLLFATPIRRSVPTGGQEQGGKDTTSTEVEQPETPPEESPQPLPVLPSGVPSGGN